MQKILAKTKKWSALVALHKIKDCVKLRKDQLSCRMKNEKLNDILLKIYFREHSFQSKWTDQFNRQQKTNLAYLKAGFKR